MHCHADERAGLCALPYIPRMTKAALACLALVVVTLSGCTDKPDSGAAGPDCSPRVRYHGTVYEIPTTVNLDAALGKPSGRGDVIGCDGRTVESANLRAVRGVAVDVAIAVDGGDYHGVYVSRDVPEASWPPQVGASQ